MPERYIKELPGGITVIDTDLYRPLFDASYLIEHDRQAAFVDVGTSLAVPALLDALRSKQIAPEQVKYVIVTHVHLDHAGGAGLLLQHLPNAQAVVHPQGAKHLIDPKRLIEGARAVYGDAVMQSIFGEMIAIPKARIIEATHEMSLDLNGRRLLVLDTPGHARHHVCIVDEKSQGIFTGDTFGLSYPEFNSPQPIIFATSSPVQFDPDALHASIDLLMSYQPQQMYLTHFGAVGNLPALAADLHDLIDRFVAIAKNTSGEGEERHKQLVAALSQLFVEYVYARGCQLDRAKIVELLGPDLALNAQGLAVWMDKQRQRKNIA